MAKGCWKDWATDEGGPGLVSLYAGIRGIDPLRAARELLGHIQPEAVRSPITGNARNKSHFVETRPRDQDTLDRPPPEAVEGFNGTHRSLGNPTNLCWYRDAHGPLFVVCRYELVAEEKQFLKALRLSSFNTHYVELAEQSIAEGWTPVRYLAELATLEANERADRRMSRLLDEAKLPRDKTLATLDMNRYSVCESD
jgi:hypothetical protein